MSEDDRNLPFHVLKLSLRVIGRPFLKVAESSAGKFSKFPPYDQEVPLHELVLAWSMQLLMANNQNMEPSQARLPELQTSVLQNLAFYR